MKLNISKLCLTALLVLPGLSRSAEIASNIETGLSDSELRAEILRMPAQAQKTTLKDPEQWQTNLKSLLGSKMIAAQARKEGVLKDETLQQQIAIAVDAIISNTVAEKKRVVFNAQFDADKAIYQKRAKELYLADSQRWTIEETVSLSRIATVPTTCGEDLAKQHIEAAKKALDEGQPFGQVAAKYSDDYTSKLRDGSLGTRPKRFLDAEYLAQVEKLKKPGDITEIFKTNAGWHILRLDLIEPKVKIPYSEAEPKIMDELRNKFVLEQMEKWESSVKNDPSLKIDEAQSEALRLKLREELKAVLNDPKNAETSVGATPAPTDNQKSTATSKP